MEPAKELESLFLRIKLGDNETLPELTKELLRLLTSQETAGLLFQIIQNPTNQSTLDAAYLYLYKWSQATYRTLAIPQKFEFLNNVLEILKTKPQISNKNQLIEIFKFALNRTIIFQPLLEWILEPSENLEDASFKMLITDNLYEVIPDTLFSTNYQYFVEILSQVLAISTNLSDKINLLHIFGIVLVFFKKNDADAAQANLSFLFEQANSVLFSIENLNYSDQLAFGCIYGGLLSNHQEMIESVISNIAEVIQKPSISGCVKCVFYSFLCNLFEQEILDEEQEFDIINSIFNILVESYDDDMTVYLESIFDSLSPLSLANIHNYILELCKEAVVNENPSCQFAALNFLYYSYQNFFLLRNEFNSIFLEYVFPNLLNEDIDETFITLSIKLLEFIIVTGDEPYTEQITTLLPLIFSENPQNRTDYLQLIYSISSKHIKTLQPVLVEFINNYVEGQCEPDIPFISLFGHLVYSSFPNSTNEQNTEEDTSNEELIAHIVALCQSFYAAATEDEDLLSTVIPTFAEVVSALPQLFEVLITPLLPFFSENFTNMIENEYNDPETYYTILDFIFRVLTSIQSEDNPLFSQEPIVQFLQWNLENTFQNIMLESIAFTIRMIYATICSLTQIIPHILTQIFSFFEDLRIEEIISICPYFNQFCKTIAENDVARIILNLFNFYSKTDVNEHQFTLLNSATSLLDLTTNESFELLDPKITELVGVMLEDSSKNVTYFSIACSLLFYGLKRQTENSLTFLHFITETMFPTFNPPFYDCYFELLFDCVEIHALPDPFLPELVEPITSSFDLIGEGCRQTIACLLNRIITLYDNGFELFSEITLATRQWIESENILVLDNLASLFLTLASKIEDFDLSLLNFSLDHFPPSDIEEVVPMANMILQIHFPQESLSHLREALTRLLSNERYYQFFLIDGQMDSLKTLLSQLQPN